ncbi:hypothetical protein F5I97DRAFT_591548 [Phlebopus sp. FC_14]|nr:hypothetical protein F5I97DRAFT_591548 [Phlebopus sp. FC_14]
MPLHHLPTIAPCPVASLSLASSSWLSSPYVIGFRACCPPSEFVAVTLVVAAVSVLFIPASCLIYQLWLKEHENISYRRIYNLLTFTVLVITGVVPCIILTLRLGDAQVCKNVPADPCLVLDALLAAACTSVIFALIGLAIAWVDKLPGVTRVTHSRVLHTA